MVSPQRHNGWKYSIVAANERERKSTCITCYATFSSSKKSITISFLLRRLIFCKTSQSVKTWKIQCIYMYIYTHTDMHVSSVQDQVYYRRESQTPPLKKGEVSSKAFDTKSRESNSNESKLVRRMEYRVTARFRRRKSQRVDTYFRILRQSVIFTSAARPVMNTKLALLN